MMTPGEKLQAMVVAMIGDDAWGKGYKAFHECSPYSDMATEAERAGWEQASRDTLQIGERIARRGTR